MASHWTEEVKARVDTRLAKFFEEKLTQAHGLSPRAAELVTAVQELTMRGGKRLRPAVLFAGYRAVSAAGDAERVSDACAALELLQSYFLVQDDWMDGDEERRGGPAVHVSLTRKYKNPQLGANLAILASDLAAGFAFELLHRVPLPAARLHETFAAFTAMHFEVVCGQQLDLLEHADTQLTHHLKTGSYTVRGPLRLGALLGDASAAQLSALEHFGTPLGVAFQLRDDLLGSFGDPSTTGKPAGHDLREGKNTALIADARLTLAPDAWAKLEKVLGRAAASTADLAAATALLQSSGVRARVEARLASLFTAASQALDGAPLTSEGTGMLRELLARLSMRDR
ncbi:MAG TPA: polyprenyl synthetase family protein [Polyangiales bacterium]